MIVRHPTALGHVSGAASLYRAALARMQGDGDATIRQARAALAAASEDQPLERGAAAGILALAAWAAGDLETAHDTWESAIANLERAGHHADRLGGLLAMADIRLAQGRLGDARRTLERGLRLGSEATPPLRGTADMHVGLAELDLEIGDGAGAAAHLEEASTLGEGLGLPQYPHRSLVAMAGLRDAQGDHDAALDLLERAARIYTPDFFPDVRPIGSVRARLLTRLGRQREAIDGVTGRGVSVDDPPAYLHEHEHITLAGARLADAAVDDDREAVGRVLAWVDRLLTAALAGGRGRSAIELTALRSLGEAAMGDRAAAAASRQRAVELAAAEGFVRPLADLGVSGVPGVHAPDAARRSPAEPAAQPLIEPLSERELEVLRMLATDLDGPEIASRLFVSLNTMRTHTKNIFAKLGVNSRRAAVTRAAELGLLPRVR